MRFFISIIILFSLISCEKTEIDSAQIKNLNEAWFFKQQKDTSFIEAPYKNVHRDLLFHEKIEDPYFSNNEENLKWIEEKEMLDLIAIGQSSPGAIAVNTSILIGYRMGGLKGAFVTISGTVLPPLIIITIVSMFYSVFRDNRIVNAVLKGMQAGVAVIIFDVVSTMAITILRSKKIFMVLLMILAFLAAYIFKVNVAIVIIVAMIIGVIRK